MRRWARKTKSLSRVPLSHSLTRFRANHWFNPLPKARRMLPRLRQRVKPVCLRPQGHARNSAGQSAILTQEPQ